MKMADKAYALELGETLRLAVDALRAHRLRSYLTLLGVILAVTSLVVVMSAVQVKPGRTLGTPSVCWHGS